ncbi:hypothetical protein EV385_0298 [Krasilnikovia cinnamomea]|uniref:Uncharacterized protein n=1 Tax=Krasilnikovia cinnamomea TaxID=349313 RepID=A0A4Q7ZEB4_9ACTN|nr:hypothetical protein [Krasilnikovia cinnamomea]RZU48581.1 hypothetical protein EV385_0298 [Krasilnikovia cinnamomea]
MRVSRAQHEVAAEHLPARPSWIAVACSQPWPCDPARRHLATGTGGGTALAVLMATYFEDFCRDRRDAPLHVAFERFLAWTRSAHRSE